MPRPRSFVILVAFLFLALVTGCSDSERPTAPSPGATPTTAPIDPGPSKGASAKSVAPVPSQP